MKTDFDILLTAFDRLRLTTTGLVRQRQAQADNNRLRLTTTGLVRQRQAQADNEGLRLTNI